jgi:flavin reductase (DIM6/NTAB) family NADH-FMN oxidoreductase RutF
MTAEPISADAFRAVLRHVPASVTVIAAGPPGRRNGLTVTSVCPLSVAPPTVLVCVNRAASAHDEIIENGYFSVNVLAAGQQAVAMMFSGCAGVRGERRFGSGDWSVGVTGAPLLEQALCMLECRVSEHRHASTHTIFFGDVVAGSARSDARPLVYVRNSYTALATAFAAAAETL